MGSSCGSLAAGLGDLEPGQPNAVICAPNLEAVDAPPGTKGSSPHVVPNETKFAVAECASCGFATSRNFRAVQHCHLLLVSSSLFVAQPFSQSHFVNLFLADCGLCVPHASEPVLIVRDLSRLKMRLRYTQPRTAATGGSIEHGYSSTTQNDHGTYTKV